MVTKSAVKKTPRRSAVSKARDSAKSAAILIAVRAELIYLLNRTPIWLVIL